jgi:hypothetical protein
MAPEASLHDAVPPGEGLDVSVVRLANGEVTEDLKPSASEDDMFVVDESDPATSGVTVIDAYVVPTDPAAQKGSAVPPGSLARSRARRPESRQ